MTNIMSNKELSKAIQEDLKKAGIPRAGYSIKTAYCGYSTSVHINIKDISIRPSVVGKIAKRYQEYERDISGEILAGGNTFVSVQYDWQMLRDSSEQYHEKAKTIIGTKAAHYANILAAEYKDGTKLFFMANADYLYIQGNDGCMDHDKGKYYARDYHAVATAIATFMATGRID